MEARLKVTDKDTNQKVIQIHSMRQLKICQIWFLKDAGITKKKKFFCKVR